MPLVTFRNRLRAATYRATQESACAGDSLLLPHVAALLPKMTSDSIVMILPYDISGMITFEASFFVYMYTSRTSSSATQLYLPVPPTPYEPISTQTGCRLPSPPSVAILEFRDGVPSKLAPHIPFALSRFTPVSAFGHGVPIS